MAETNPYADFDYLRTAAPPPTDDVPPAGSAIAEGRPRVYVTKGEKPDENANPYARFDAFRGDAPRSEKSPTMGSIALQIPAGFNEVTADTLGAPVDATTWILNRIPGVKIDKPFGGSQSIKDAMGVIGANPDNAPAQNTAERIARGAGGGIAGMIVPEAAIGTLARGGAIAPEVAETAGRVFGRSAGPGDVAKTAVVGGTAGSTGEAAAEVSPEKYKPAARLAGNIVGGGSGALVAEAPRLAVDAGRGARDYLAPTTATGQESTAAKMLAQRATSPTDVLETLDSGSHDLVPGSKPTTFQATGDMGLGSLEREVQTHNPNDFQQRRANQNAARLDALSTIQPTGNPADVSAALRRQLGDIDETTNQTIERATADARTRADAVGGTVPPEQRGSALRGVLQDAEDAARRHEGNLWRAVDPEGRLAISMGPVQEVAEKVYGNLTTAARSGLAPTERTVLDVMGTYRPVEPFRELTDLRSAVSSAMRNELVTAGRSPAYARLSQLRGGIEEAIGSAVEHQAAQEAHAVGRGELSPEATTEARLRDWQNVWYSRQAEAGAVNSAGADGNAGSRSTSVSGPRRAAGEARERPSNASGDQGLPRDVPLEPNFDEAARERLNTATAATRERAQTFNQGLVGQVLKSQGQRGSYRMLDAGVPDAAFKAGPKGYETINAFRRAIGDEHAETMLHDTAASSLRQFAMKPDGTLDPVRFASWQQKYSDALRALPADLGDRFADAARATEAIDHVAVMRRDALETYQRNAIGKLIEAKDPEDVTKIIGGVFSGKNPVGSMRELITETANDPTAREGLRKAVVDYIAGRFISNTEAAASDRNLIKADAFQTFVKQHTGSLRQVLTSQEYNMLKAIAADLRRSNRSLIAVKIPGQSNTAQDSLPELKKAMTPGSGSLLAQFVVAGGGGYGVHGLTGALTGIAGVLGKNVIGRMHEAGMEKVGDLIRQAMLDPELARILLAKAPAKPDTGTAMTLAHRLRRLSVYAPTQATNSQQQAK
jgi:hypothetical protein